MPITDKLVSVNEALSASKKEIKEWYREYLNPDLEFTLELVGFDEIYDRAEGCQVYLGLTPYLDFSGGYGVLNLGHNHPEIIKQIQKIGQRPNILQASLSPLAAALARNLALITPGKLKKSFFCNSGAEAIEGALKIARAATKRTKIIYCENSFHGKTFGALSATGKEKYQAPFSPLVPDFFAVPFGDPEALEKKLKEGGIAAFIVEPIQGEGGIVVPPTGYLKEAERLCREYEALLIIDEVQTGLGRTGTMFACEEEKIEPDILCLAKALSGGLVPIGAYVTTDEIWQKAYGSMENCLLHTSTFGGNALACAAALATIDLLCRDNGKLIAQVREKGGRFLSQLNQLKERYDIIKEVRGRGLLVGIEFNQPEILKGKMSEFFQRYFGSLIASQLRQRHRIITTYTLNNPNVIRLQPPLLVSWEELDYVVESLGSVCRLGYTKTLLDVGWQAGKRIGARVSKEIRDSLFGPKT